MMVVLARARFSLTVLFMVVWLQGCSDIPYIAGEAQGIKEREDQQTGSNLARRDKNGNGVREIDKDALESSLRGINANRDNGK